jgi:Cu/Ag efflux pump CusA
MVFSVDDFSDFLRENFGKFSIVLGVILFFSGLFLFNTFGSFWSALSLFFGIVLATFGLFLQLEFFGDLRSLNGFGSILLFASIVFFALSISFFQFVEITSFRLVQEVFKGAVLPFSRVVMHTERPFLWLCGLFFWLGIFLFVAGLAVKIVRLWL